MKIRLILSIALAGVVALTFLSVPSHADDAQANKKAAPMNRSVNLKLGEETAVKIAEVILVKVYGDKVLDEKPWKISDEGDVFAIKGTLKPGFKGGVASIKIRKTNAEVVAIIHGK